jgi:O-glycosyl hydrolase
LIGSRKTWMTELSEIDHPTNTGCDPSLEDGLRVARNVHRYLAVAGVNAYIYFWGMSKYDNNSALVRLDLEKRSYVICKRLYAFGQFSRFIRPGSVRIGVGHDCGEEALLSAYRDENGKLVIVAVNASGAVLDCSLNCEGLNIPSLAQYVTDQNRNLEHCGRAQSGVLTLPAKSVSTFVAE